MKKIIAGLLSVTMALGCIALPVEVTEKIGSGSVIEASAYETYGDFEYAVLDDGTVEITDYLGDGGEVVIPNTINGKKVTAFSIYVFSYRDNITGITIPNSITSIDNCAFYNCTNLTSMTIPDSIKEIGEGIFIGCTKLKNISVDSNNSHFMSENGILYNKEKTELLQYPLGNTSSTFTIPNNITNIKSYAFSGCESINTVIMPSTITNIEFATFDHCTNLTNINIPDSVKCIESFAFRDTKILNSQTKDVKYIGKWAVDCESEAVSVSLKPDTTGIANSAFDHCSKLLSIVIPDNVLYIGTNAFYDCTNLHNVEIPNSCIDIGWRAFDNCVSFTSITIPDNVSSIGGRAFQGCSRLETITIPSSVTIIGESAFGGCNSLKSITVDPNNKYYVSEDGILFNKDKTKLIKYPATNDNTEYTIPDNVKSIEEGAFAFGLNLTSVTIPNGVANIGELAFHYCNNLTMIIIPNSVTSIGSGSFNFCDNLKDINYKGTSKEWSKINIDDYNYVLTTATIHFNYDPNHTHSYISEITKTPTCSDDGVITYTCSCEDTYTETIKATGHTVVTDKAVAATCTTDGKTEGSHCSICGRIIKAQKTIPTKNHTFGSWTTTKKATCTATGTQTRKCSVCGKTETKSIAKLSHTYKTTVVSPTYAAQGYTLHKCSSCGASYKDKYTAKKTVSTVTAKSTYTRTTNAVRINWNKVSGVTGYKIYRYNPTTKKWVALKAIYSNSTLTYKDSNLKSGTVYKYKVKAFVKSGGKFYFGNSCSTITTATKPVTATITKTAKSSTAVRLYWKKVTCTGYKIRRYNATTKKWVDVKTVSSATTNYRITNLKKNTSYKFRVCAYKNDDKKNLPGAWSYVTVRTAK